jgi:hypothetical protein
MEPEGSFSHSQELTTCSYLEPDQFSPHHPIPPFQDPSYSPPTYVLVFIAASFPLAFLPIILTLSSSPYSCYMPYRSHPPWLDHSNYTWRRVQITKLLIMQFSPPFRQLIPSRCKYPAQRTVLKDPPFMSFPWCQRTIFTSIRNHR